MCSLEGTSPDATEGVGDRNGTGEAGLLWAVACLDGMLPRSGSAPVQQLRVQLRSIQRARDEPFHEGLSTLLALRGVPEKSHEKKVLPPTGFEPARS